MAEPEIRLLGGVQAYRDGELVSLGGRRGRTLIALLALDAGRTVSIDRLARGLWDEQPPERVRGSLQTYVSRLRRALGESAVTTEPTGYALRVSRDRVDVLRFRDAVAAAQQCASGEEEAACLDEALGVWGGEPFEEELSAWVERFERPRLVEEYLQAMERRLELDLERGEYASCALRLGSLVQEHPLRETLWVLLLRALEAGGRTAEALERYEAIRSRLAAELGADPGPELQQAHHRLLTATDPVSESVPGRSRTAAVPRELPAATAVFAGRSHELARLEEAGTAGGVVAVHGPGGVGKTSLVVQWAHRVADRFPDGQLFVNLRGFGAGEAMAPAAAAELLLRSLGVAGTDVPEDLDARTGLLRSVLADRRCLLVLDNARDAAQVRPLLPGGPSVVVVTSRRQLRSLSAHEGAVSLPLDPMSQAEAVEFLRARLSAGAGGGQMPEEVLLELAEISGHLPVALAILAERVGRQPAELLETVADLRSAANRLDVLATGEDDLTDVRAVFEWTFRELDEDAAQMFALLGLYPDSPVGALAASALGGLELAQCRARLDRLAEVHLIDALPEGWYAVHDLVRAFAGELAQRELPDADRNVATRRLRSWFVHTFANARYAMRGLPTSFRFPAPAPGIEPQAFSESAEARLWFPRHEPAIRTLITEAERDEDHHIACGLVGMLASSLPATGNTAEARLLAEQGLQCAERSGDVHLEGVMADLVGFHRLLDMDNDRAREALERAQTCFAECADWASWARTASKVSDCLTISGQPHKAVTRMEEVCRRSKDALLPTSDQGWLLSRLALARINADDLERGVAEAKQAVEALMQASEGTRLTVAHEVVANGLARLHRWSDAEREVADAASVAVAYGAKDMAVEAWIEFARLQRAEGEPEAAKVTLERAAEKVDRFEADGDFDGNSLRTMIQGRTEDLRTGSTAPWSLL